jgi:hypothetical protein
MNRLRHLIAELSSGRVPLGRAFWEYAIAYGSLLNLLTTAGSLALFAGGYPAWLGLAVHFLPVPYNLLMIAAVWRSAAVYRGPQLWSVLARALIIVWAAIATAA